MGKVIALQMVSMLLDFQAEIGTGAAVAAAMGREIARAHLQNYVNLI